MKLHFATPQFGPADSFEQSFLCMFQVAIQSGKARKFIGREKKNNNNKVSNKKVHDEL